MLQFAADMQPPIDLVLWTGGPLLGPAFVVCRGLTNGAADNPAHDMWMETPTGQLEASRNVTALIRKYFPATPVIPVYGNHEARALRRSLSDGVAHDCVPRASPPTCTTSRRTAG
jgi:hypothetical protein